jgi:hypothetical protein
MSEENKMPWMKLLNLIPFRTMLWVAAAACLVLILNFGYNSIYNAGYEQARQELVEENYVAINAAVERARAEWKKSAKAAEVQLNNERNLLERIHELEDQINLAVNTVGADCRHLGDDVLRLFNAAAEAANGLEPAAPAEPAETVR